MKKRSFRMELNNEWTYYLKIKRADVEIPLLDWWKDYSVMHLDYILAKLAQIDLSIHPTSIESERLFSQATLAFACDLRDSLKPETLEMMLILKADLIHKEEADTMSTLKFDINIVLRV